METVKQKKVTPKVSKQLPKRNKTTVVILYIHGLSEAITQAYRRHGIHTATKPLHSIKSLLLHPKDKRKQQNACECANKILCKNYEKTYIQETGIASGVWLQEHQEEVTQRDVRAYTLSPSKSAATEQNKSAVTDYTISFNHVIDRD